MPVAVHFGAGNIGRGFIADLYYTSGYEIVFLDIHKPTIEKLKRQNSFQIRQVDEDGETTRQVTNYTAYHSMEEEAQAQAALDRADIVTCSVGPKILRFIAPLIAGSINRRDPNGGHDRPLAVIACENMIQATDSLKQHIFQDLTQDAKNNIGQLAQFANCAIDRIVPAQSASAGLTITIEKFYEWCVESGPFVNGRPPVEGIKWVDDLAPYIERKLFTVNTGHATTAYLGYHMGIETIDEAIQHPDIRAAVDRTLSQTGRYIETVHHIPNQEQREYINKIIKRFKNDKLKDTCKRVARDPMRKLGRNERFIQPAALLAEQKLPYDGLMVGIENALRFQNIQGDDESAKLGQTLAQNPARQATTMITGLQENHPLFRRVLATVEQVKNGQ